MREEAIVAFRRDGQSLRYRIADPRVAELIGVLHGLYCRRD
jgi:ArsR family transcriptional regulator